MNLAQVSVVIPCYNHGAYLREAIQSVLDLDQAAVEIIVVNDGSTDKATLEVLKEAESLGIRVFHQENKGAAAARNYGISQTVSPYFIPLDADNVLYKPYFQEAVFWMDNHPNCAVVYGDARIFGEKDGTWCNHTLKYEEMAFENYIDNCALIRKSSWEKVGGYDTKSPVPTREDYILWLDFLLQGFEFHYLNAYCFGYRFLEDSKVRRNYRDPIKRIRILEYIYLRQERLISFLVEKLELDHNSARKLKSQLLLQLAHYQLLNGSIIKGYQQLSKALVIGADFMLVLKQGLSWPIRRWM